jgi:proline dehydrogenase
LQNPNDLKVLVDAEQSFVQRAIEDVVEQLQAKYNQEKAYIINTLQNYLKIAQQRADY